MKIGIKSKCPFLDIRVFGNGQVAYFFSVIYFQ